MANKTGKLEEWRKSLAIFPEENQTERLKIKWINLTVSFGYTRKNFSQNNVLDMKVNLFKSISIAVNPWFSIQK